MIDIPWRLIGIALLAAAIAGAVIWLGHRVSLSYSQAETLAEQRSHIAGLELAAERDQRNADELGVFRAQQSDWMRTFHEELGKKPLMIEVSPHVDPKTGAVAPCIVRNPARYRELFNAAVEGAAAAGVH